jgi:hypothetical protein
MGCQNCGQSHRGNYATAVVLVPFPCQDNGAISQFTLSHDSHWVHKPVTMETSMTEADFSGKGLGISGAIMLSAFLPKCM